MNIAVVSLNNQGYQPLADLTWDQNKALYAERHGYAYACKTDNFYNVNIGFEKIWFLRDMLEGYPDIEWIWWTGCDTLITNFTIKLEDIIDNNYHFIIATDCNDINADSFLIRNSPEGRAYIQMIIGQYPLYYNHNWAEQQVMIDTYEDNKDIIKIVPQKTFNSYDCKLYPTQAAVDRHGNSSDWTKGDLLIHWPGTSLPHRMQLAQYYLTQVVTE